MYVVLHVITLYSCPILMKPVFSRHLFEKYSNIRLHENPSRGSRVIRCGRTDRHEANSRLSQFLRTRLKTAFCGKYDRDYVARLQNAVNFLVA